MGGGLIIFSKCGLKLRKNDRYININFNQFSSSFIVMAKNPVEITLIYRPPNSGTDNMDELCEIIETAPRNAILIGDFNLPDVNWRNESAGPRARRVLQSVQKADMVQLIEFTTHDKGNILDLIVTTAVSE
jgi:hypothetical protein